MTRRNPPVRRHAAVQPQALSGAQPLAERRNWDDTYEPFPPLPVHTERCAECAWPDICAKDRTCWKDPAITLERARL